MSCSFKCQLLTGICVQHMFNVSRTYEFIHCLQLLLGFIHDMEIAGKYMNKGFISLCKFHGSPDVMCLYVMYNFISVFNFFLFVLTFFKCLLGS